MRRFSYLSISTPLFSLYSSAQKHMFMVGVLKINFVLYPSTDEEETQLAFRKHFDHQLELYKTVVSIYKNVWSYSVHVIMATCDRTRSDQMQSNPIR